MRIGRHMPTGSQPVRALRTAKEIGCEAVQVFVTNPRGWRAPEGSPRAEGAFRAAAGELGLVPVVVHATYLINLASPRDDFFERSVTLLCATLQRAGRHGAASVVLHIGSHMGAGEAAGLARLAAGLRRTLEEAPPDVLLLLENDVGAGGELGYRFENLAAALDAVPEHAARLGVCIDTAHLWGAGFDIGTAEGAAHTLDELERTVGLRRVPVVHLNDTKVARGSHRDVHARLGEGIIGREGLRALLRHPGLAHATALLETPIRETAPGRPDWDHDAEHLRRAYALAGRRAPRQKSLAPTGERGEAGAGPATVASDDGTGSDDGARRPPRRPRAGGAGATGDAPRTADAMGDASRAAGEAGDTRDAPEGAGDAGAVTVRVPERAGGGGGASE